MSIRYEFCERFSAENSGEYCDCDIKTDIEVIDVLHIMQRQLAVLCSQLLCNNDDSEIGFLEIIIEVDGKTAKYSAADSKGVLSAEIQMAIQSLVTAKKIKIALNYDYLWRAWKDYLSIGPFVMADVLSECEDDIFNNVDYVMHKIAENDDGAGVLAIYGNRNGTLCRGVIDYTEVDTLPSFGKWFEPNTWTIIEDGDIKVYDENIPRVTELCRGFEKICPALKFSIEDNILYLDLNQPFLDTPEKTIDFVNDLKELAKLVTLEEEEFSQDSFYTSEFVDISETGPNLLKIEISYNGEATISMALAD